MKVTKTIAKAKQPTKKAVVRDPQEIHQAISLKAYELYLQRNGAPGDEKEDWLKAQKIVLQSMS